MAKWSTKSNDMGVYIECSKCKRKIGAEKVVFADIDLHSCPTCGAKMKDLSGIKMNEIYESLDCER